jgi:hypothetical protein
MLAKLANASVAAGHPEWGKSGPNNAGTYNSSPTQTGFFNPSCNNCDNFASPYGQFFLSMLQRLANPQSACRVLTHVLPAITA